MTSTELISRNRDATHIAWNGRWALLVDVQNCVTMPKGKVTSHARMSCGSPDTPWDGAPHMGVPQGGREAHGKHFRVLGTVFHLGGNWVQTMLCSQVSLKRPNGQVLPTLRTFCRTALLLPVGFPWLPQPSLVACQRD